MHYFTGSLVGSALRGHLVARRPVGLLYMQSFACYRTHEPLTIKMPSYVQRRFISTCNAPCSKHRAYFVLYHMSCCMLCRVISLAYSALWLSGSRLSILVAGLHLSISQYIIPYDLCVRYNHFQTTSMTRIQYDVYNNT